MLSWLLAIPMFLLLLLFAGCLLGFSLLASRSLAQLPLADGDTAPKASSAQTKISLSEIEVPAGGSESPIPGVNPPVEGVKKTEPTEVTSLESTYDNGTHIAIFTGSVTVKDPEFNVICDKLTATLRHGPTVTTTKRTAAAGKLMESPASPGSAEHQGGLKKALAESNLGQIVTITQDKVNPDGTIKHSVGHSQRAFYDGETGDISLSGGKPDMKQDKSLMVALEERTVLILNRDGRTRSVGSSKTYIIQTPPSVKDASNAAPVGQ